MEGPLYLKSESKKGKRINFFFSSKIIHAYLTHRRLEKVQFRPESVRTVLLSKGEVEVGEGSRVFGDVRGQSDLLRARLEEEVQSADGFLFRH